MYEVMLHLHWFGGFGLAQAIQLPNGRALI